MSSVPAIGDVAVPLRAAAREELLARYAQVGHERKDDGSLLSEADLAMQQRLSRELAERWPQTRLLGEEMDPGEQQRLLDESDRRPLWCLDPLDGTSNFVAGLPFFTTSLALLVNREVVLGLVYDPLRDELFSAERGGGAWVNDLSLGRRMPSGELAGGIGLVDFKRLPADLSTRLVEAPPYSSQRSFGSVALDWCWIAAGRAHVYLHGKQRLWDYAAAWLVLTESGGHALTLAGEPVFRPGTEARSVAAALRGDLFETWCAWLGIRT